MLGINVKVGQICYLGDFIPERYKNILIKCVANISHGYKHSGQFDGALPNLSP